MKLRTLWVLALCLLVTLAIRAEKIPNSAWQSGILDAVSSEQIAGPSVLMGQTIIHRTDTITHYTLHGQELIYDAIRRTIPRDKPLNVTIHSTVHFAIVGSHVYLKDAEGKIHKLDLVSKSLP